MMMMMICVLKFNINVMTAGMLTRPESPRPETSRLRPETSRPRPEPETSRPRFFNFGIETEARPSGQVLRFSASNVKT